MRELTYYVAVSLDGRIAAPDGGFDVFPVEGDHMTVLMTDWVDTIPAQVASALGLEADRTRFDTVVMGWNTYAVGLPFGMVDPYPHLEQVVFSRSHGQDEVPAGIRICADDPVAEVQRLKKDEGVGIWLAGGGRLAGALADEVDRLVLKVNPIVLGDGIPAVTAGYDPRTFDLVTSTPYRSGVVINEYVRQRQ